MTMPPNISEPTPSLSQLKVAIGGSQKLSLVDYPGHVAAALFLSGCNMRCGYCHNPELVLPERLAPSIPVEEGTIDFIAMDVKGPLEKYVEIAARPIDLMAIKDNVRLMIDSGIGHEFRTTIVREQLEVADFEKIGELVRGAKRFALQHFRTGTTISPKFANYHTFTNEEFRAAQKIMERYVEECVIH